MNTNSRKKSTQVILYLLMLMLMIYGKVVGVNGKNNAETLADGSRLVVETQTGAILVHAARGTIDTSQANGAETSTAPPSLPVAVGKKRIKNNNRKSNKSAEHLHHARNRKGNNKRLPVVSGVSKHQQFNESNAKHQRQIVKQQQHSVHEVHHKGKNKSGQKSQLSINAQPVQRTTCRYTKSIWSECNAQTNLRTRTLTLKKGEPNCLPTRTMQNRCGKACRYEKGSWSECKSGQMTREDKLKILTDRNVEGNCEPTRSLSRKCNAGGVTDGGGAKSHVGESRNNKEGRNKGKVTRRILSHT